MVKLPMKTTFVILASGPSLTFEDVEYVKNSDAAVITVNTTFKIAPWADVHYSNDNDWYETYLPEMLRDCEGRLICGYPKPFSSMVETIPYDTSLSDLSFDGRRLCWGGNSGFAAINLAIMLGAKKIVLLGYDHDWTDGNSHHHGDHPKHLQHKKPGFHRWTPWHERAAVTMKKKGIEIYNCTPTTNLRSYPIVPLRQVL
jgi:hypothetical protein